VLGDCVGETDGATGAGAGCTTGFFATWGEGVAGWVSTTGAWKLNSTTGC